MNLFLRSTLALSAALLLAGSLAVAQSAGEAAYTKNKCALCHGAAGLADSPAGKALKVKPVTDADVKSMSLQAMIDATTKGSGKMQAYKGKMTDAEIKDAVTYFRTFIKK